MAEEKHEDLSILLSGEAGQGIQTLEKIFMSICKKAGYCIFSYSEFMSRIRGGNNSTQIRISSNGASSYLKRIDVFVPLGSASMERFADRITSSTLIIGDPSHIDESYKKGSFRVIGIPLTEMAKKAGNASYMNMIITGILTGILRIDETIMEDVMKKNFHKYGEETAAKNSEAAHEGFIKGTDIAMSDTLSFMIRPAVELPHKIMINGAEAITIGGLAGGCNFVSSYPMSPSTNVLVNFAKYSGEMDVIVEQAEDEICAINMALGSWYAGGRAMVTTSGGGFALMTEAVSLAACMESPIVIHIAQRPGPATGLPTRTEQADLMFALFSGHGEFSRAIYAPGTHEEGIILTQKAFYLADRYQIPVFILTDQYFLDSNSMIDDIKLTGECAENHIIETAEDYKRHKIEGDSISPRGIPGFGRGIVCLDSDEHTEDGYITEDFEVRTNMVKKRLNKKSLLDDEIISPTLYGPSDYRYLLVCWGSTASTVREAIDCCGRKDTAMLHFSQVYPLHKETSAFLNRAEKRMIIENNATSQFGMIIKLETGMTFHEKLLKFNGMPFMVEEITEAIKTLE
jgi:2-oxoglutarate ferredoxin oxidoreductase subunit alpha